MRLNFFFKTAFLSFAAFYFTGLHSQNENTWENIDSLFSTKKEIYFSFEVSDKSEINNVSAIISVDNVSGNTVTAYAGKSGFGKFVGYGYKYTILKPPSASFNYKMIGEINPGAKLVWDAYPNYNAYLNLMQQFAQDYPDICSLHCIDTLPSGRLLLALKISDNVNTDEDEPEFFYSSSIHGDELTGYVLTLRLADYLLSNYNVNPDITDLVNNIEIWITPLANPDGTFAAGNHTIAGATRFNSNGVDLNRNFPDPAYGPHPDYMAWQPETKAFMKFAESRNFVMGVNIHGGAEVVNYPWDTWSKLHADDQWWQLVGREYADTVHNYAPPGYLTDMNNGVTNGYAWYQITGGRQDYMNYFRNCREFTLEISDTKTVPDNQLNAFWNYNYRSLLAYLKQVTYGIQGKVTDACTGLGVRATVVINTHDKDNSHVYSMPQSGRYYRPVFQGTYDITYAAAGYQNVVLQGVNINNFSNVQQDVVLNQVQPVANFVADTNDLCSGLVRFTNTSVAPEAGTIWEWSFGDGKTSSQKHPLHKYNANGTYSVKLKVTTSCGYKDSVSIYNFLQIIMPPAPIVSNASSCGPAVLSPSVSGNGTINWYYTEDDTLTFHTGNTYVTPLIDSTHTYYVEDVISSPSVYGGKLNNGGAGQYYASFGQDYLVFNCFKEIELVSVKVYAGSAGIRTIDLLDASNNIIESADVMIPQGESRINLNFSLPAGNNLKLAGPPGANLYINSSGVSYPYTVPGLFSITNGSDISNPLKYYFYFYDWEVREEPCSSPRVPVSAYINDSVPVAGFSYIENSLNVNFTDLSDYANEWFWDFGDGNSSNLQNPVYQYLIPGNYQVKLRVLNACGEDSIVQPIIITGINENDAEVGFVIYPNPSNGSVSIAVSAGLTDKIDEYFIYDITGRNVLRGVLNINNNDKTKFHLHLPDIMSGIYILKITGKDFSMSKRLVIVK